MISRRKKTKKCIVCGNQFSPKPNKHFCCCRKCYMNYYYKKKKEEEKFPSFVCPRCSKVTLLDFHPKKNILAWKELECECGYKNSERIS